MNLQQSQQHLLSVTHKLPEANSLLPSEIMKSQPAHHIRKRVNDIVSVSSHNWPLDEVNEKGSECAEQMERVLGHYYGPHYQITNLVTMHRDKIVFINGLADLDSNNQDDYNLGSVSIDVRNVRKSLPRALSYPRNQGDLEFDDRIQSGNLFFALQHNPKTYILANRLDYNTRSYGQWFYFKVTNSSTTSGWYTFYIVNMTKNSAMFGKGLKVSICRNGVWGKQGADIRYLPNKFLRKKNSTFKEIISSRNLNYYTLSFTLEIDSRESVYVAYNEPYTYTRLGKALDLFEAQSLDFHRSILCRTPLGNRVEKVTVTRKNPSVKSKKVIFITGRAHPIQTAGSFVMEGILAELSNPDPSPELKQLLDNYLIKIIPMINPDGVIIGNSRCNTHGYDLNRQWKDPKHENTPQIYSLKKEILKFQGRIQMFLDLHGHSKKKNVFAYGCHDFRSPFASRQFPYLLSKMSSKGFLFSQCRFTRAMDAKKGGKEGTARVSLWNKLKIPNIFTIQNSYCSGSQSKYHYDHQSYAEIGREILQSICCYFNKEQTQKNDLLKENIIKDLISNKTNFQMGMQSQTSSQSEMEERIIQNLQGKLSPSKLFRNKTTGKSKTQKYLKKAGRNIDEESQLRRQRRNETIDVRRNQSPEMIHSNSQIDGNRKKYLKNLEPLNKRQFKLTKCGGGAQLREQMVQVIKRKGQSQPLIRQIPFRSKQSERNHGLSIIQIGMTEDVSQSRDYREPQSATGKKSKNECSFYNRMNEADLFVKDKKFTELLKLNSSQRKDSPTNSNPHLPSQGLMDFYYPRHPVLKSARKNTSRMINGKREDLLGKIKEMHQLRVSKSKRLQ